MSGLDLVMRLEDLPNRNKNILQDLLGNNSRNKTHKEAASEFFGAFQSEFVAEGVSNMDYLTDYGFYRLSDEVFKDKPWPKPDTFVDLSKQNGLALLLYKEMMYRHMFSKMQYQGIDVIQRCEAWENYVTLLTSTTDKGGNNLLKAELPSNWIWEILDEAIYQFQNFCSFCSRTKKNEANHKALLENKDKLPTFDRFEQILKELIQKSGVQNSDGTLQSSDKPKTMQLFGYYAYVALIKLYAIHGFTQEAYNLIQNVSAQVVTSYLKKSWGCLVSFLYFSGLTYIQYGQVLKGTKILEKCCSFFYRYRHLLSKSSQADKYARIVERATLLLTIVLSFNKIEIEDNVMRVVTDKYADRYQKLLKYDQTTFEETFTSGCCKIIKPLKSSSDLEAYIQGDKIDMVPNLVKDLLGQLNKYRILNGVESILLIYSSISVDKLAKILGLKSEEVDKYLKEYDSMRKADLKNTPFEQTVLASAMTHLKTYDFEVKGDRVQVTKINGRSQGSVSQLEEYISELSNSNEELRRL